MTLRSEGTQEASEGEVHYSMGVDTGKLPFWRPLYSLLDCPVTISCYCLYIFEKDEVFNRFPGR